MRISLYSALAVLSFGLIASQPAAASTFWTCMSPEFGCGSAGSPSGSSHNYRARERVYAGDSERRVPNYRAKPRHVAERAERRAAPVRMASVHPRNEERRVISDAAEAPKRVAFAEPRNEEASVATDVSTRKPEAAPDVERTAAVRSAQSGMASYYGNESGSQTASGARFNAAGMTAAHRTLPFGTKVRVTNKSNGRSVVVTINDRGPFVRGRIIDLSTGAAGVIGMQGAGVAPVLVEVLGKG